MTQFSFSRRRPARDTKRCAAGLGLDGHRAVICCVTCATVVTVITAVAGSGTYSPEPLPRRLEDCMERLILLLDDLDDLLGPAFSVLTHSQWLRVAAVLAVIALVAGAGAPWPVATMLALPALPLADLAHARLRRVRSLRLQAPALLGLEGKS